MGLTIHYRLKMGVATKVNTVIDRLDKLRAHALTLGLKEVSEVRQFEGAGVFDPRRFDAKGPDEDWGWFVIQSHARDWGEGARVIGFRAWPGEGCEEANFGLVKPPGRSWRWGSFCKTQYAGDPECGGTANFVRCHMAVVSMLDEARRLKILADVSDEGEFWEKRDVQALAREVGEWDEMVAAEVGKWKDLFGGAVEAPILNRPDFEHLEARGRAETDKESE